MSRRLIAGVGLRRGCGTAEIVALVRQASASMGRPVDGLAAPAFKRDEAGLAGAAAELGLALLLVDEPALQAEQPRCVTQSAVVARAVGVGSVAEASALAAAGPGARLVLPRINGPSATCAVAEAP